MTQSAGIQLQVGLDLAFFRQQLTTLGATAAGYPLKFKVEFDRRSVQNELNALGANIKKRNYFLEVKTNLGTEIDNAKKLADALVRLRQVAQGTKGSLPLGTGALGLKKGAGQPGANDIRALYEALAMAGAEGFETGLKKTRAQMVTQIGAVAQDTVAGLLNGINSQDARVQAAARSLGESLITSIKATLGIASPSKKFEEIGKNVGQGFEKGALSSMDNAFDALENKMRQRGKILDTVARGIFRMLGMDPAAMLQQARALPPLNFGATVPRAPAGIGPSSSGRMLPAAPSRTAIAGTPAPAGLLPSLSSAGQSKAIIEALIASTGPRLLPSGGGDDTLGKLAAPRQTKDAVDAILRNYFKVVEAQVREVFSAPPIKKESLNIFDHLDTEQYFNYLAQARVNADNTIRQSIEEAKQVARRNQVKDAAQSFLRALEETVRNAERSVFVQSRIAANQSYVQKANIREIGQPLLGGRQVVAPKMLSAATGFYRGAAVSPPPPETQAQLFARREREARMRSALRGVDVMGETPTRGPARYSYANRPAMPRRPTSAIVPYAAGGALVPAGGGSGGAIPPRPPSGGGGGMGGMANFGNALSNINLPGAGVVREIGSEFAMAAKQVLLFGTAYKALAFLTSFPSQVGESVGALQSFRNTLSAISPTAQEAAASSEFILNIVDKYNVPLQSARDGFTKLYASMAPTGFSGNEIRDLFTGISQAAATFGMSSDKVDRVTYAFAQMASKGQVMSEELKGQLGDVLPGAMGIFAKAAGFEGADAIQKFGKALEDGAYKGKPMRDLLKNVTIELKKEFGPGAEGAARTYQGVMTRMANSTRLLYESFEPVAINFLNSIVVPITNGLKTVTDGFNAFFTGTLAKTAGGAAFAQQLSNLKPAFEGIRENIGALIPSFQTFGKLLLSVAQFLVQLAGNPIAGFLLKVYANVLLVNTAFTLLGGRIILGLIASVNAAIIRFVAFGYAINAVGIQTTGANTALAGTQLQMALLQKNAGMATGPVIILRNALLSIANIGIIAIGINVVINGLSELDRLKKSLAEIGTFSSAKYRKEVSAMAKEDVNSSLIENRRTQKSIQQELGQYKGPVGAARGLVTGRDEELRARLLMVRVQEQELIRANKTAKAKVSLESQVTGGLSPVEGAGADGAGETGRKDSGPKLDTYNRSQLDFIKQNAEQERLALDRRLQQRLISETQYKISLAELELETAKLEQTENLRLAREQISKDNLSAQDKQLKLADAQTSYQNELNIAQDKYTVAVEGATKELEGPFNQALESASGELLKQQMIAGNLQVGIAELTPDQESYLQILSLVTGKTEDELNILKDKIAALRETLELTKQVAKENRFNERLNQLRDEIDTLRVINSEERRLAELRADGLSSEDAQKIFDLEKIKKNIEDTRALIDGFVSQTSSDYKGFLKAVISGEDAVDALKQFQQGLKDRVLTIFLDFAMAPVEKFMKEAMEGLLLPKTKKEAGVLPEATTKDPVEATNINTNATNTNTAELKNLTIAIQGMGAGTNAAPSVQGPTAGNAFYDGSALPSIAPGFDAGSVFGNPEALTGAFANIQSSISTSMEGITSSFQMGADSLANTLPSWSDSLTTALPAALTTSTAKTNSEVSNFQASLGKVAAGIGIAAGSIMGIAAGISQIKEGGTSNVLGGIGSIMTSIGGGMMGFMGMFGANGGVAPKGWKPFPTAAFANGGMVTGPTLGLVGEGKYNEAIVPLPDGRSIPVQMRGGSSRDLLNAPGSAPAAPTMLSMSFQSTTINGAEYVDRAQLEAAMAETRKSAARDGASRGASLALDKLQNSPSARRRIGIR